MTRAGVCQDCNDKQRALLAEPSASNKPQILIITTTATVPGREIGEILGIVSSQVAFGMNIFKDIATAWRDVVGGRAKSLQGILVDSRKQVFDELASEAKILGADAVVCIDLDMSEFSAGNGMVMLIATGTAVRFAPMQAMVEQNYEAAIRQSLSAWNDKPPAGLLKILSELDAKRRRTGIDAALAYAFEPLRNQNVTVALAFERAVGELYYSMSRNDYQERVSPLAALLDSLKGAAKSGSAEPEQWRTFRDAVRSLSENSTRQPSLFAKVIEEADAAIDIADRLQSELSDLQKAQN
jgi:uncharacterized protein YbjQ (UPF0145 family)